MTNNNKITVNDIIQKKQQKEKIAMLTAYDFLTGQLEDQAGIDIILVGDSLGMVIQGNDTTQQVTVEEMVYHTRCVSKGVKTALIVGDMPYLSYETISDATKNAHLLCNAGADVVKLEGNKPEIVKALKKEGIKIMGHIGLTPQTITQFKVQGKTIPEEKRLLEEAKILEKAGCFALVLECIPLLLAKKITESVSIPTIGIGAGPYCDGQVLVIHDLLGMIETFKPKFLKQYASLNPVIKQALLQYKKEVKEGIFPDDDHSYH